MAQTQRLESEYTRRMDAWLTDHGITYEVTALGEEQGFNGEKPEPGRPLLWHDTYSAVFTRTVPRLATLGIRKYYQSAAHSRAAIGRARCMYRKCNGDDPGRRHLPACPKSNVAEIPHAYDLLACLTKSDPGTFGDFCSDFGYDEDSRMAERTYFAVQEEWMRVRRFFTPDELVELHEVAS